MTDTSLLRRALLGVATAATLISCSAGGSSKDATKISKAELRKALPNAADVGGGYKLGKSGDDDSSDPESDAAFDKACPEIKKLGLDSNKKVKDGVQANFLAKDGRSINTAYDTSPDNFGKDQLDAAIAAINKCDTARYTASDGTKVEIDLSAKRDDSHGDAGLRFKLQARADAGKVNFTVDSEGLIFNVDGLGVQVVTQGSVDENDLSSIAPDADKIDDLADTMTDKVRSAES